MAPLSRVARISTRRSVPPRKSLIISAMVATSLQLGLARGRPATWVNLLEAFETKAFSLIVPMILLPALILGLFSAELADVN